MGILSKRAAISFFGKSAVKNMFNPPSKKKKRVNHMFNVINRQIK